MDIATITDVLDYVRKCSKLVNAFIIGIIRQTQADDLTKPIENVENYDFSIDGHIDLRLKALNIIKVGSINSIFYFLHKAAEPFNCLEQ
ncbi:hypothetical protein, partial [Alistipes onderdonkii]